MKIDKRLNLVVPIYDDAGKTAIAYVHSAPISREVFDRNFLVLAKTHAAFWNEGLGTTAGPRVAAMLLRLVADQLDGPDEETRERNGHANRQSVENGLFPEIRRLSNVAMPDQSGAWKTIPLENVVREKLLNEEDLAEVENAIVFFIVAYAMHKRTERAAIVAGAARLWGARIESLNSTEFARTLTTSTGTANSGEKAPAAASAELAEPSAIVDGKAALIPH